MHQLTPTPLPEILSVLESITAALRSADVDRSMRLQAQALLRARLLDSRDQMILSKVIRRIRKASPNPRIPEGLEACLATAGTLELP